MRHDQPKILLHTLALFCTEFPPQGGSKKLVAQMLGLNLKRNAFQFQGSRFGELTITQDLNSYRVFSTRRRNC